LDVENLVQNQNPFRVWFWTKFLQPSHGTAVDKKHFAKASKSYFLTASKHLLIKHFQKAFVLFRSPIGVFKTGGIHESPQELMMNQLELFHGEHLPSRLKCQFESAILTTE
jgi:hypothetical protein